MKRVMLKLFSHRRMIGYDEFHVTFKFNNEHMKKVSTIALIFCVAFFLAFTKSHAQTVFYNNGLVHINDGGVVHVNGAAEMDGNLSTSAVQLHNDGDLTVANSTTNGDLTISNGGVVQGGGDYYVENDWINNATFVPDTSYVNLNGANQQITGTSVTTFYDLELTGTGIKTQTLDAEVSNQLMLNDRELATQAFTMYVTNRSTNAVTNNQVFGSEGFVSSDVGGALSRLTNTSSAYLFPVGSSSGIARYRAVEMTPVTADTSEYLVRFANNDPTTDGYNRDSIDVEICSVNDLYYHMIDRSATSVDADITIYYDNSETYSGLAQWATPTATLWNDMGVVSTGTGTNYDYLTATAWADFSQMPFALTDLRPSAPLVNGPNGFCAGQENLLFYASGGSGNSYSWDIPSDASIVSGSGTDSIYVTWGDSAGTISVVSNSATGCSSAPSAPFLVNVLPGPSAYFYTDTNFVFENEHISFTDTSKENITSWSWDFGDGDSSNIQNPYHKFPGPGEYIVELLVENEDGCIDTVTKMITILEGFNIPNVFSPNGDGVNDVFYFANSGIEEFSLKIFNRWGEQLFSSVSPEISWDGRTSAGIEVSNGTYFYEVRAKSESKDYGTVTGTVTLVR